MEKLYRDRIVGTRTYPRNQADRQHWARLDPNVRPIGAILNLSQLPDV
jgi:hypothetical protein